MNRLIPGPDIAALLSISVLVGYVGHVISADVPMSEIQGPVFGNCCATCPVEELYEDNGKLDIVLGKPGADVSGSSVAPGTKPGELTTKYQLNVY